MGEDSIEAVIENVGSLLQNVSNKIDDKEDEDYGFTSLLSARVEMTQFILQRHMMYNV